MILDPVTAILPWDPRDLLHCYGSYIVISSWDPGDPGSFFLFLRWDPGDPGS